MTAGDWLQVAFTLSVLGGVAWVSYAVGRDTAERQAQHTISTLRQATRQAQVQRDQTQEQLSQLQRTLREARVQPVRPPEWMS